MNQETMLSQRLLGALEPVISRNSIVQNALSQFNTPVHEPDKGCDKNQSVYG